MLAEHCDGSLRRVVGIENDIDAHGFDYRCQTPILIGYLSLFFAYCWLPAPERFRRLNRRTGLVSDTTKTDDARQQQLAAILFLMHRSIHNPPGWQLLFVYTLGGVAVGISLAVIFWL